MINSYLEKFQSFIGGLSFGGFKLHSTIDFHSKSVELAIVLVAILLLSFLIDRLLVNSFLGKSYRFFVAPGIILHELSHALLCLLTGAKIKSISFFDKEGGSVKHESPKLPFFGQIFISLAPFVSGVIAIYFLSRWLGIRESGIDLTNPNYTGLLAHIKDLISRINFSSYTNWLILYLALSVIVTMTPSKQDFRNIAIPLILIILAVAASFYFKLHFNWLNYLPMDRILIILSPIVLLLILALLFSIIIYVLTKVIER